jgi:hypothetical protein
MFLYNVIIPRKRYDDDELRSKDLSYREKGKQLGRSSYKAWELISPYENHQPKITQVAELNGRIAQLNSRINELNKVADDISAQLKKVKTIKETVKRVVYNPKFSYNCNKMYISINTFPKRILNRIGNLRIFT